MHRFANCAARQRQGSATRPWGCDPLPAAAAASSKPPSAGALPSLPPLLPPPPLIGRRCLLLPAIRPSRPDKDYHDISFVYWSGRELRGNEAAAERNGREVCLQRMGLNWFWVSTEMASQAILDSLNLSNHFGSDLVWLVTCRRTGLPKNAVLMW